jgi:cytochrome oxidase Cu insertion factor (SCO1/SenC/PrrC family)
VKQLSPDELRAASTRPKHPIPSAFWAITILLGVAAGIGLVLVNAARTSDTPAATPVLRAGPDTSWPAGQRQAPDFRLRDQNGQPISLSLYRGRPVIVTFIDPLCRNLCPVEAGVLGRVVKALPSAARPAIVAVSVNPEGDGRANLLKDIREWHVGATWRWAVGDPKQLEAVWHDYEIGVSVAKKTFAGVTVREVTHTEAAFLIDPAGYQRALYVFPFEAADVEQTVRRLESSSAPAA